MGSFPSLRSRWVAASESQRVERFLAATRARLAVHSIDVLWPALIAVFTAGPNSPFYLFYTFVLLEAAYRWGLHATLMTALASTALFIVQAFITLVMGDTIPSPFKGAYDLNSFVMRG